MAREINLVPDIKDEMIKTLKLRNFIFFLCIVVASASVAAIAIFLTIAGGQNLAITSKEETISKLSEKLANYSDLNEFLTIKGQVDNISTTTDSKKVFSRTFNILGAMLADFTATDTTQVDTVHISELSVNFSEDGSPVLTFDAQANAGVEPFIDYRVLDAFQKSMQYLKYDYGDYVDKDGNAIPAYCIIEKGADGAMFKDERNNLYAYWTINGEGCNTLADGEGTSISANVNLANQYDIEEYEDQQVVRIWRTPQYEQWYRAEAVEGSPYMSEDGQISNVAHFVSSCINYKLEVKNGVATKLDDSDNSCDLVPTNSDGTGGISISESSNGRDASDELVLRFSATVALSPDVYTFSKHHFTALPPTKRYNVTDSYVQVQHMFSKRAADCAKDDAACNAAKGGQ